MFHSSAQKSRDWSKKRGNASSTRVVVVFSYVMQAHTRSSSRRFYRFRQRTSAREREREQERESKRGVRQHGTCSHSPRSIFLLSLSLSLSSPSVRRRARPPSRKLLSRHTHTRARARLCTPTRGALSRSPNSAIDGAFRPRYTQRDREREGGKSRRRQKEVKRREDRSERDAQTHTCARVCEWVRACLPLPSRL